MNEIILIKIWLLYRDYFITSNNIKNIICNILINKKYKHFPKIDWAFYLKICSINEHSNLLLFAIRIKNTKINKFDIIKYILINNLVIITNESIYSSLKQCIDYDCDIDIFRFIASYWNKTGKTVDYIDKLDELFVECDCGEYKKMTYEEFMNSTTCGCDNNG